MVAQGPRFVCFYHGWGDQFDGNMITPKLTSELVCPTVSADDKYRVSCMRCGRVCVRVCVRGMPLAACLCAAAATARRLLPAAPPTPPPPPQAAGLLLPCLETLGCVMARERRGVVGMRKREAWRGRGHMVADGQQAAGSRRWAVGAAADWRLGMC